MENGLNAASLSGKDIDFIHFLLCHNHKYVNSNCRMEKLLVNIY